MNTDYIDVYFMHGFDAMTPMEETMSTLDSLVKSGKFAILAVLIFLVGT